MSKLGRQAYWTAERILASIAKFQDHHGRWPETKDFDSDGALPSQTTVNRAFGTLAEARRRAGMPGGGHEGHGGGGRGGGTKWQFVFRPARPLLEGE